MHVFGRKADTKAFDCCSNGTKLHGSVEHDLQDTGLWGEFDLVNAYSKPGTSMTMLSRMKWVLISPKVMHSSVIEQSFGMSKLK